MPDQSAMNSYGRRRRLIEWAMLAVTLVIVGGGRAEASPYKVTDVGRYADVELGADGYVRNLATGIAYSFPNTVRPLNDAESANLPTTSIWIRPTNDSNSPSTMTVTMSAFDINGSGTVIGSFPMDGDPRGYGPQTKGYTVRSADGRYSPFVSLTTPGSRFTDIMLSQANQILVNDDRGGARLVDVRSGAATPISQFVPSELLRQYSFGVVPDAIDDRGDILVHLTGLNGWESFILTPPGLDAPAPVPEPSTLLIFAAVGAMAVRTVARRRGAA